MNECRGSQNAYQSSAVPQWQLQEDVFHWECRRMGTKLPRVSGLRKDQYAMARKWAPTLAPLGWTKGGNPPDAKSVPTEPSVESIRVETRRPSQRHTTPGDLVRNCQSASCINLPTNAKFFNSKHDMIRSRLKQDHHRKCLWKKR